MATSAAVFGWYVDQINRKMDSSWYRSMVDPRTPKGARTYIELKIFRDGSHGDVRLDSSSGSPTWDNVCLRAAQRVDTFGPLPLNTRSTLRFSTIASTKAGYGRCNCGDRIQFAGVTSFGRGNAGRF